LSGQGTCHDFIRVAAKLQVGDRVSRHQPTSQRATKSVGDPHVALTVDTKTTAAPASVEFLRLARIGCRKTCDMCSDRIGHPNAVPLIDAEVKRGKKRPAGLYLAAFTDDVALGPVTLRDMDKLVL